MDRMVRNEDYHYAARLRRLMFDYDEPLEFRPGFPSLRPPQEEGSATEGERDGVHEIHVTRPSESTPPEDASSTPGPSSSSPRPESASSVRAPSRFSTTVPGRTPSPAVDDVEPAASVPWTSDATSILDAYPAPPESDDEGAESPSTTPEGPVPTPLDVPTSPSSEPTPAPTPAPEDPPLVHDTDPPFMTDGRGRVVWSSATASRSRRSRNTATSTTTAAGATGDKPRERDGLAGSQTSESV